MKKVLSIIFTLLVCSLLFAKPTYDKERNEKLYKYSSMKKADIDMKEYKKFLDDWNADNPEDPGLIFGYYAYYAMKNKNPEKGEKILLDGIKKYPDMVDLYMNLAEFYMFRYEFNKSADILCQAINRFDKNKGIFQNRDFSNFDYGGYNNNLEKFSEPLAYFLSMWGEAYVNWNMPETFPATKKVIDTFMSKVKKGDTALGKYYYDIGCIYKNYDLDLSEEYLLKALDEAPGNAAIIQALAFIGYLKKDTNMQKKWEKKLFKTGDEQLINQYKQATNTAGWGIPYSPE